METAKRSPGTAMVTGLFRDRASAERAWHAASSRGYGSDELNLVMSDETRKRYFAGDGALAPELGSKAAEGAGIGAGIGGALGAIAGALAALGTSIALPGLGLVVAGPLAAGLAGAGAGGITGGVLGALVGAGIPEERVRHYEEGIRDGGILIGVAPRTEDDARHLEQSWRDSSGEHVVGTGLGAGTRGKEAARPDLAQQEAYWRDAHAAEPYRLSGYAYEDYAPAYHLGYSARGAGESFDAAEARLAGEWEDARGASRLTWEQARPAVRAAWERVRKV
jgi:hypothetical protein